MPADHRIDIDSDLSGRESAAWFAQLEEVADDLGEYYFLGKYHAAALIEAGPKLMVTFENAAAIIDQNPNAEPLGFHHVRYDGWSHLGIYANADNWYRDPFVYSFFDRLSDDGFFDGFDDILFYGKNAGAYAAAAYSAAAPGARVLAIRPQATLDPRVTGFDTRFKKFRRQDFHSRYGYAPDMIDAADKAYIAFDPFLHLDAMHGALFTKPNVMKLRCAGFGGQIELGFEAMNMRDELIRAAMDGTLTTASFGKMFRARRDCVPYLRRLFAMMLKRERPFMAANVCAHAVRAGHRKYFEDRLRELQDQGYPPYRPIKIKAAG